MSNQLDTLPSKNEAKTRRSELSISRDDVAKLCWACSTPLVERKLYCIDCLQQKSDQLDGIMEEKMKKIQILRRETENLAQKVTLAIDTQKEKMEQQITIDKSRKRIETLRNKFLTLQMRMGQENEEIDQMKQDIKQRKDILMQSESQLDHQNKLLKQKTGETIKLQSDNAVLFKKLAYNRKYLVSELLSFFPVNPISETECAVMNVKLTNSFLQWKDLPPEVVATGISYLVQILCIIPHYLSICLPYRMEFRGSRSLIWREGTSKKYLLYNSNANNSEEFQIALDMLNWNVIHLCLSQGVAVFVDRHDQLVPNLLLALRSVHLGKERIDWPEPEFSKENSSSFLYLSSSPTHHHRASSLLSSSLSISPPNNNNNIHSNNNNNPSNNTNNNNNSIPITNSYSPSSSSILSTSPLSASALGSGSSSSSLLLSSTSSTSSSSIMFSPKESTHNNNANNQSPILSPSQNINTTNITSPSSSSSTTIVHKIIPSSSPPIPITGRTHSLTSPPPPSSSSNSSTPPATTTTTTTSATTRSRSYSISSMTMPSVFGSISSVQQWLTGSSMNITPTPTTTTTTSTATPASSTNNDDSSIPTSSIHTDSDDVITTLNPSTTLIASPSPSNANKNTTTSDKPRLKHSVDDEEFIVIQSTNTVPTPEDDDDIANFERAMFIDKVQ